MAVEVTAAGVDTCSPCWYVEPYGHVWDWLNTECFVAGPAGSRLLPVRVLDDRYRLGWFPNDNLMFVEGHPLPGGELCPGYDFLAAMLELQEALLDLNVGMATFPAEAVSLGDHWADLPLHRHRPMGAGWAGFRRCDSTVNVKMPSRAYGLAVLSGIAAIIRDMPGKSDFWTGADRGVESVFLRGYAGKKVLGRWYDKGIEENSAFRGRLIRAEDQRRWAKNDRRELSDLDPPGLRRNFHRRFYPLYKQTKGVIVGGPVVLAEKAVEAVVAGELTPGRARMLLGDVVLQAAGAERDVMRPSTLRRSRRMRLDHGLVLADGVFEEVEVDLGEVLEAVMETDAWERRG